MSTAYQDGSPSFQRQIDCCQRFAEQAGLTVHGAYEDAGTRETPLDSRTGLQAALDALRGMGSGVLITENSDRIAASREDYAAIQARIEQMGAALVCAEEQRIGSPTDEFRADIARAIQDYRAALVDEIIEKSILLSPETQSRLQERAEREGRDMHQLADELLAAALAQGQ